MLHGAALHESRDRAGEVRRRVVAPLLRQPRVPGDVKEADGRRSLEPAVEPRGGHTESSKLSMRHAACPDARLVGVVHREDGLLRERRGEEREAPTFATPSRPLPAAIAGSTTSDCHQAPSCSAIRRVLVPWARGAAALWRLVGIPRRPEASTKGTMAISSSRRRSFGEAVAMPTASRMTISSSRGMPVRSRLAGTSRRRGQRFPVRSWGRRGTRMRAHCAAGRQPHRQAGPRHLRVIFPSARGVRRPARSDRVPRGDDAQIYQPIDELGSDSRSLCDLARPVPGHRRRVTRCDPAPFALAEMVPQPGAPTRPFGI